MELSTPERITRNGPDDDFAYTEFSLDWREPSPPARFGNRPFMWGCVAFAVGFMAWMSSR